MLRNVFLKSLRDQRRSLTYWGIGFGALTIITVLFYPAVSDAPELSELLEDNEAMVRMFAGGFTDLTSPEGYLNSQLYALLVPILFLIFAIAQGSGAIAGEEERGTLDILLSNPTTRLQVLLQKFAAMVTSILVLGLVLWATVLIGAAIVDMDLSVVRAAEVTASGALLGAVFGTLALALGSATGKRGRSTAVAGAVAVTAYFFNALVPLVDGVEKAAMVSPFYYYLEADPLSNGLYPAHVAALAGMSIVLMVIAVFTFERRDLRV
jgi:ABC-2 type transport system permease protein